MLLDNDDNRNSVIEEDIVNEFIELEDPRSKARHIDSQNNKNI